MLSKEETKEALSIIPMWMAIVGIIVLVIINLFK